MYINKSTPYKTNWLYDSRAEYNGGSIKTSPCSSKQKP